MRLLAPITDNLDPLSQMCLPDMPRVMDQSSKSTLAPQHEVHAPVPDEANRWFIVGQYLIYGNAMILNDNIGMTRLVKFEQQFLTGRLHIVPEVHKMFTHHGLGWMACSQYSYREEVV